MMKERADLEFINRIDESSIRFLSAKGYVPEYGAMLVKRVINDLFVNDLTMKLLEKELDKDRKILVNLGGKRTDTHQGGLQS